MPHEVDVVLCTSRRPHTVACAALSVLRQERASLALHVVGDGTDQATEQAVSSLRDPRVRFLAFPKSRGPGTVPRNTVLRTCHAPFIAYMTDDDLWFPDHLQRALAALWAGATVFASRPAQVLAPDIVDARLFAFDWSWPAWRRFGRPRFVGLETVVHRREAFAELGYWNESLARFADNEFYNRLRAAGRAVFDDTVTVLRFYARDWDHRYRELAEPPQVRFLDLLSSPEWRESVRARARPGHRSLLDRRRQASQFARLALSRGLPFARDLLRARSRRTEV